MSTDWMANQLIAVGAAQRQGLSLTVPRYNPRPKDVICEGSATHAVLLFLEKHPNVYFSLSQLIKNTGRTKRAVDFAVIFLKRTKVIEATPDTFRSPRYLKYRLVRKG